MFRKITSLFLGTGILFSLTGCSLLKSELEELTYYTEVPPVMTFLGDSIAAGYGLEGYTYSDNYSCPDSYSNILKEKYTAELADLCEHKMYNFAVSGAESGDLLELLESGSIDEELAESNSVVVSIGGNDMLHIILGLLDSFGVTAESKSFSFSDLDIKSATSSLINVDKDVEEALIGFEANLLEISDLLSSKTEGKIYIQTLYNPLETYSKIPAVVNFSEEKLAKFNNIIKDNSYDKYEVIDVAAEFTDKCDRLTRISDFDIHPNEKGHRLISTIVDRTLREEQYPVVIQQYGEPHLTIYAILLIAGGFIAMFAVVLFIIPKLFKKYED